LDTHFTQAQETTGKKTQITHLEVYRIGKEICKFAAWAYKSGFQ